MTESGLIITTTMNNTNSDNNNITNNSNNDNNTSPIPTMDSVPGLAYFELNDNKKRKEELIKKSTDQIRSSFLKEGILDMTTKITQLQKDLDDIRIEAITTENVLCKFDEPDDRQLQALERRFHLHQQQFDQLLSSSLLNQQYQPKNQNMTASTSFTSTLSKVSSIFSSKKITELQQPDEKQSIEKNDHEKENQDDNDENEEEEEEEEKIDDKKLKRRERIKQLRQEYLQQLKSYDPNWEEDESDWKSIQFSIKDGEDNDEEIKGKGKGKEKINIIKNDNDHKKKKEKKSIKKKPTLLTKKNKKNGMTPSPTTSSSSFPSMKQLKNNDDTSSIHSVIKKKKTNSLDYNNHPLSSPIHSNFEQQSIMKLPINNIYPSTNLDTPPITPIVASWIMDQQHHNNNDHIHPINDHFSPPHSPLPYQQRSNPNRLSRNSLNKYDIFNQNRMSFSSQPSIVSSTRNKLRHPTNHRHSLYDDVMKYIDSSSTLGNDQGLNHDIYQILSPRQENHQRSLSFHSSSNSSFYSTSDINHWQQYNMMNEPRYRRRMRRISNDSRRSHYNNQYITRGRFSPIFYQLPLVALFLKQGIFGIFSILFNILFGIFSFLLGGIQRVISWFKFVSVLSLALIISLGRGPSHMLQSLDEMDYLDDDENINEMDENDHDNIFDDYYIHQHSY